MPENILGRAFLIVKEAGSFLKEWTGGLFILYFERFSVEIALLAKKKAPL
jgi:hypothetical protein